MRTAYIFFSASRQFAIKTVDNRDETPRKSKTATLIGVPLELGASRGGARFGPQVIRTIGLSERLEALGYSVADDGDIEVEHVNQDRVGGPGNPKNLAAIVEVSGRIADAVERAMRDGSFPVVLGGDHSMAVGVLAGIARVRGPQGVIWIDAHADLNTPATTPTGNVHGMSMAAALGAMQDVFLPKTFPTPAVAIERSVFVGLRELDPAERQMIITRNIACFTMTDIDRLGMAAVVQRAIEIAGRGPDSVHVSFDIDCLDPTLAPGTGTPVPGGLTYREAHLAMELVAQSGIANSLELSEVNPLLDEHNTTARVATELICSALGKSIL